LNASGGGAFAPLQFPSLFQTNPGIPFKFSVPDVVFLACSHWHITAVLDIDWSTHNLNVAVIASGCVDASGKAMIWNVEGVVSAFKGWGHEGLAGFIKIFDPGVLCICVRVNTSPAREIGLDFCAR